MLEELKNEVVKTARRAEELGLCQNKSGNFSALDDSGEYVLLTPSGVERSTMTADDIVVLNRAGKIIEVKNGRKPSSEALMHLAAYDARADFRAIAHTHSPFALAFAVLEEAIPAIIVEAAHLHPKARRIPLAPFGKQGTEELARSVKEPLAECDGILLSRHGVLAGGSSLDIALTNAAYVEEIAKVYHLARQLGKNPEPLDDDSLVLRRPKL